MISQDRNQFKQKFENENKNNLAQLVRNLVFSSEIENKDENQVI